MAPRERRGGGAPRRPRNRPARENQQTSRSQAPLSEMEAEMQPDYGSVLIGKSRNVNAVLRFKYYRFIGERLKK